MAQSGYTPILIYASGTASNVPLAANLTSSALGAELALNYADGKLYFKNNSGVVTLLAGSGGGGPAAGSNTQIQFNNSGVFGASANFTWDGSKVTASAYQTGGNLTFTGTGNRITGDTANATIANRLSLVDSTTNSQTIFSVFPNGTGTTSQIQLYNGTDTTNYARFNILTTSASMTLSQTIGGTGTYLPMTFNTGGSERMRIDTSGNVGIGTSSPAVKTNIVGSAGVTLRIEENSSGNNTRGDFSANITNVSVGAKSNSPLVFTTNDTERMRIDTSGRLLIGTTSASGSNYLQVNSDALINGLTVGKGAGAVATNIAVGTSALAANTIGAYNVAIGRQAMLLNTDGSNNVVVGSNALDANISGVYNTAIGDFSLSASTGSYNTALGADSLRSNTTASNNTAVGYQAAYSNVTGAGLTAIGYQSLQSNTGDFNTAVGRASLNSNTSGGSNAALGYNALINNSTGSNNTGIGMQALNSNTTASSNTAVGYQAAYTTQTTGYLTALGFCAGFSSNNANGDNYGMTLLGARAGYTSTTAKDATFVGAQAGYLNTTGSSNTALGAAALYNNTTASNNTAVGYQAGYGVTTGGSNTTLGNQAGYNIGAGTRNTYLGAASASNQSAGGNDNTGVGYGTLNNVSSGAYNIAVGGQALQANTTASNNTAVGYQAGYLNTTSSNNTAVGYQALYTATSGGTNTAVGYQALTAVTTGGDNTAIGRLSGSAITTGSKNTILGEYNGNQGGLDIRTASKYIVLSDGDGNPRMTYNATGVPMYVQAAPTSKSTTATLTGAEVLTQILNTTGTTYTVTLPTGTNLDTATGGMPTDTAFDFTVINTASGTITVAVNTGITSLGTLTVATETSASFKIRKTAANTFVIYRM